MRLFACFVAALLAMSAVPDNYPRNSDIDILNYTFRFTLSDESNVVRGQSSIDVRFERDGVSDFAIDLIGKDSPSADTGMVVDAVENESGTGLEFDHSDDRIRIQLASPSVAGERRTISVSYHGVPEEGLVIDNNKYGERTFFGDNFPDRGRYWLASMDHPYEKATCDFIITAPQHYQVIANGLVVEETDLGDGMRLTHWRQSVPISTYLMVIGVARFAVQYVDSIGDVSLQTWVYAQDREPGFHDFARSRRIMQFFISHVGPYPFEKLAHVQSKTRWGGMENASNIFYSERSVSGQRRSEGTMVHETAHQWFGDSATAADWNHNWLSEGFATYFTQLYNEFNFGRDRFVEGMERSRGSVINFSRSSPGQPLVDNRLNVRDAHNGNNYQKGAWLLHLVRRELGDEAFWAGIREYYRQYSLANALTEDFQRVMEETSGKDLEELFHQWVYVPGQPKFEGDWYYDAAKKELVVRLEQTQPVDHTFRVPLDIGIVEAQGSRRTETLQITERSQTHTLSVDSEPLSVVLDPDVWLLMEEEFGRR